VLLLDTHVWVRWVSDPPWLSSPARAAIDRALEAGERLQVSSISAWEVALLVTKGRLELTLEVSDWIARSEASPSLEFVPVDNRISVASAQLPPPLHWDPADRIILATARGRGLRLVTADRRLREYPHVDTVW